MIRFGQRVAAVAAGALLLFSVVGALPAAAKAPSWSHKDANVCGQTGQCGGNGACEIAAAGTDCGQSCNQNIMLGDHCNGVGMCSVTTPIGDCAPYNCSVWVSVASCLVSCVTTADCSPRCVSILVRQ